MSNHQESLDSSPKTASLNEIQQLIKRIFGNTFLIGLLEFRRAGVGLAVIFALALGIIMVLLCAWGIAMAVAGYYLHLHGWSWEMVLSLLFALQILLSLIFALLIYGYSRRLLFPATRKAIKIAKA